MSDPQNSEIRGLLDREYAYGFVTDVDEDRMQRVLSLFRMEFEDPNQMRSDIAGRPIYMALSMTPEKKVRLKPQNLLVNLPLARES